MKSIFFRGNQNNFRCILGLNYIAGITRVFRQFLDKLRQITLDVVVDKKVFCVRSYFCYSFNKVYNNVLRRINRLFNYNELTNKTSVARRTAITILIEDAKVITTSNICTFQSNCLFTDISWRSVKFNFFCEISRVFKHNLSALDKKIPFYCSLISNGLYCWFVKM